MNENYESIHGTVKVTVTRSEPNKVTFSLDPKSVKKLSEFDSKSLKEFRAEKVMPDIKKIKKDIKDEGSANAKSIIAAYVDRYEADINKRIKFGEDATTNQQKLAYYEACISGYFAAELTDSEHAGKVANRRDKTINRQEQKLFAAQGIFDMAPEQLDIAKEWLVENVKKIEFKLPFADEDEDFNTDRLSSERQDTLRITWKNNLDRFKDLFPDAVEGLDYKLRHPSAEPDIYKDIWRPTATIFFKTSLKNAPQPILTAIENAKEIAKQNGFDVKSMDATTNDNKLTSYYFAIGALDLFGNDLHFYKHGSDSNNFLSGMDKIMDDYKDVDKTTEAFMDLDFEETPTITERFIEACRAHGVEVDETLEERPSTVACDCGCQHGNFLKALGKKIIDIMTGTNDDKIRQALIDSTTQVVEETLIDHAHNGIVDSYAPYKDAKDAAMAIIATIQENPEQTIDTATEAVIREIIANWR